MSVSKAVISGIIVRDGEKRFTSNDLAVLNFTMNIDEDNEMLLRVMMFGKLADSAEPYMKKGTKVIVEGRLQTNTFKDNDGNDRKIIELQAQSFDVINTDIKISSSIEKAADSKFMPDEEPDELIGDDEIPF